MLSKDVCLHGYSADVITGNQLTGYQASPSRLVKMEVCKPNVSSHSLVFCHCLPQSRETGGGLL